MKSLPTWELNNFCVGADGLGLTPEEVVKDRTQPDPIVLPTTIPVLPPPIINAKICQAGPEDDTAMSSRKKKIK
ncbi:unnamed protein product [Ilex paraguariensis]|uniref:Uncharacterized protein n=1 Tax=Ilex paraguariensis TaxID=185542 RepID=A0ABC8QKX4_9AQUA